MCSALISPEASSQDVLGRYLLYLNNELSPTQNILRFRFRNSEFRLFINSNILNIEIFFSILN